MDKVITFGCRLNSYESELIKNHLKTSGLQDKNVIVLNSCNVTDNAEKDLMTKIRQIKKQNPDTKIILTGCSAQTNPQKYAENKDIEFVIGNIEKTKPEVFDLINRKLEGQDLDFHTLKQENIYHENHKDKIFRQENKITNFGLVEEKVLVNDIMSIKETSEHLVTDFSGKTRAFIQIQNGCNHRCTFCVIPFGRGNSRSVPFGKIVEEINILLEKGYKEFVLTGVDITDYGKDISSTLTLGSMIKRLLKLCPNLHRLRLSSIDVAEVDRDLMDLIWHEERFMPHLHLSLQSGNDLVLKRMARRHTRQNIIDFCRQVRASGRDFAFGADIIAGFPTEDEQMFADSISIINECEISFIHAFTFSARKGTAAAKMPQIDLKTRKNRTRQLIETGKIQLEKLKQRTLQKPQKILIESNQKGRCENFVEISLPINHDYQVGELLILP